LAASQLATGSLEKPEQFRIVGDHAVEVVIDRGDRLALGNLCVPYAIMINSTLAKQHASSDDPWAMNWLKDNAAGGLAVRAKAI
jgi:peptide/nickel transport system substrate-binding protein